MLQLEDLPLHDQLNLLRNKDNNGINNRAGNGTG